MTQIAVLGPRGVGGFLAAALARAGEPVTVVVRERTAELIESDGIEAIPDLIMPLLNRFDHLAVLRARFAAT
jgi:ketopantoate reductase